MPRIDVGVSGLWESPTIVKREWIQHGTNTPEAYLKAGFDLDSAPTLHEELYDRGTGAHIQDNYYYVANGPSYERIVKAFHDSMQLFKLLRTIDGEFPSYTKSIIAAVDPAHTGFDKALDPDSYIQIMPKDYSSCGGRIWKELADKLDRGAVDFSKPYGLTPTGKPRRNPVSAYFRASTPKYNTATFFSLTYDHDGSLSGLQGSLSTRKGNWNFQFRSKKGQPLTLFKFEKTKWNRGVGNTIELA